MKDCWFLASNNGVFSVLGHFGPEIVFAEQGIGERSDDLLGVEQNSWNFIQRDRELVVVWSPRCVFIPELGGVGIII